MDSLFSAVAAETIPPKNISSSLVHIYTFHKKGGEYGAAKITVSREILVVVQILHFAEFFSQIGQEIS